MHLAVDLHENLVQVPLRIGLGAHLLDTFAADLRGEQRAEHIPPETDRLVTDINPSFVQQVFDISEGKWEPNVHHHRKPEDFGAALKVLERITFSHLGTLQIRSARLKQNPSDIALCGTWGESPTVVE